MQLLIICAVLAYFLYAIAAILDKHIVSNTSLNPVAYAFYSGFFQVIYVVALLLLVLLTPWLAVHFPVVGLFLAGLSFPATEIILLAILDGVICVLALLSLYRATKADEISRISPIIGVLVPIFTFLLTYALIGETLNRDQFFAFVFLVLGGFLMSAKISREKLSYIKGVPTILLTGFLFALYYVIMDYLFATADFAEIFILIQFGGFVGAMLLLASPANRAAIRESRRSRPQAKESGNRYGAAAFFANKGCSAVASLLIYYAINISSATLVNSLQAVQYAFVFLFTLILSRKSPGLLHEERDRRVVLQKGIAIAFTAIGVRLIY